MRNHTLAAATSPIADEVLYMSFRQTETAIVAAAKAGLSAAAADHPSITSRKNLRRAVLSRKFVRSSRNSRMVAGLARAHVHTDS